MPYTPSWTKEISWFAIFTWTSAEQSPVGLVGISALLPLKYSNHCFTLCGGASWDLKDRGLGPMFGPWHDPLSWINWILAGQNDSSMSNNLWNMAHLQIAKLLNMVFFCSNLLNYQTECNNHLFSECYSASQMSHTSVAKNELLYFPQGIVNQQCQSRINLHDILEDWGML